MADPVRRRLLRVLEDSPGPRDVASLATTVDLHPNTVRGHLDVLERAGLVVRRREIRHSPGRPRLLYSRPADAGEATPGGYRLLAEMLTTSLRVAADDPAAVAHEAGRRWGHQLTVSTGGAGDDESAPLAQLIQVLDDFGFGPSPAQDEPGRTAIMLSDCPFRDLARQHPDIVCSLHLGMMRGFAETVGDTLEIESLEPFVEPSLCRTVVCSR